MRSLFAKVAKLVVAARENNRRRRRGCLLRSAGCLLLIVLAAALLLFGLVRIAGAAEARPPREDLAVQLVIDNSNSMFDKGGVGSDPELLRLSAARLFIEYLGVDDARFRPSCGILFFGSAAHIVAPLTLPADAAQRAALTGLLAEPERLGWTDQLGALELARDGLTGATGRRAIILLTDGKPEWSEHPTPDEQAAYRERMAVLGAQLGHEGIDLFIILLAGPATDADADIAAVWQPVWAAMAAATPEGRFLIVRAADDLPATYHNVLIALTGRQTDGVVVDGIVPPAGLREVVAVEPGLARLVLAIRKSHPDTDVAIRLPGGGVLHPGGGGGDPIRRSGGLLEEVWTIERPTPGQWLVTANGQGRLTVWKDFEVLPPTVAATAAKPAATATTPATSTPVPTPVPTATAVAASVAATPSPPDVPETPSRARWPILGALALISGGIGGYAALRRRARRPVVSGTLHVLEGPEATPTTAAFDLYALGKAAVTIGTGEADIPLPALSSPITLRARAGATSEPDLIIRTHPDIIHNGRRLLTDQPIYDGDQFIVGQTRLRYENLQRRRPCGRIDLTGRRPGIQPGRHS